MRVLAPGKLLLTGAYAVLEGAPAIVCAVDRYAVATGGPDPSPMPEVVVATSPRNAPAVDVTRLRQGAQKLGLGSSAAAVVAALGYVAANDGADLRSAEARRALFQAARDAHERAQAGGSGVDVAASVHGGVLRYALSGRTPSCEPRSLPEGLRVEVYFAGVSARTTELRARVEALRTRDAALYRRRLDDLGDHAARASAAVDRNDATGFVAAASRFAVALAELGRDADASIVPPFAEAPGSAAQAEGSAFLPSGAGGGDVFVRLATAPASDRFDDAAREAGFVRLDVQLDTLGVRTEGKLGEAHT